MFFERLSTSISRKCVEKAKNADNFGMHKEKQFFTILRKEGSANVFGCTNAYGIPISGEFIFEDIDPLLNKKSRKSASELSTKLKTEDSHALLSLLIN